MKLANIAKLATAGIGLSTLAMNSAAFAADPTPASATAPWLNFGRTVGDGGNAGGNINKWLVGTDDGLAAYIQTAVNYLLWFITIIAVIYGIYGGFLYMTAGGEEEKTKKAKAIFKQVAIGLVVIFLAYSAVTFVQDVLSSGGTSTSTNV